MTTYYIETLGGEKVEINENQLQLSNFLKQRSKENPIKVEIGLTVFKKVEEFMSLYLTQGQVSIPEPLPDKLEFKDVFKDKIAYAEYIEPLEFEMVFELINAGALLELDGLHDLACAKIASFMKGKSPEEVNQHFTIECQLTNDEAKELGLEIEDEEQQNQG
eukprot:CAMPEP_0170516626 /NCGR_PEP_ID=MMETSP0209-20121228/2799_1 /TAXON_ID=665100 ORGANISM="Litonotus pictus, Strain P1" /NCGR_SAMPLE_ID=MMETSP0209 /ASSEMBLY_ACC=CAM_ASM_000301 /LENGTH=161 /DNA_ID=CAMNT_0010801583 /DNA_START=16 /DNA_END=501 /DNA_ORIENTATION=+